MAKFAELLDLTELTSKVEALQEKTSRLKGLREAKEADRVAGMKEVEKLKEQLGDATEERETATVMERSKELSGLIEDINNTIEVTIRVNKAKQSKYLADIEVTLQELIQLYTVSFYTFNTIRSEAESNVSRNTLQEALDTLAPFAAVINEAVGSIVSTIKAYGLKTGGNQLTIYEKGNVKWQSGGIHKKYVHTDTLKAVFNDVNGR